MANGCDCPAPKGAARCPFREALVELKEAALRVSLTSPSEKHMREFSRAVMNAQAALAQEDGG